MNPPTLIRKLKNPMVIAGFVACLLFPFGWQKIFPGLEDFEIHVPLSERPPEVAEVSKVVPASIRVLNEGRKKVIWYDIEWRTSEIELAGAGRYSVYGASPAVASPILDLRVNGELISALAFYRVPEMKDGLLVPHRIATGIRFNEGRNRLRVEGGNVLKRPLLIVLRPEKRLSTARYLLLFSIALASYVSMLRFPIRNPATVRGRAGLMIGASALLLVLIPGAVMIFRGEDICRIGDLNPALTQRLADFDAYMASEEHLEKKAAGHNVVVLGDSSHFMRLQADEQMVPALRRKVPERLRETIDVYGIASGGFSAFDFYFLLNRLIPDDPDLVIIPINQRWFSDQRIYRNDIYDFYFLEADLRFSELPAILPVQVGDRDFSLRMLLYQKLIVNVLDRKPQYFADGATVWARRAGRYLEERTRRMFPKRYPPIPFLIREAGGQPGNDWNDSIAEDHDFFQMFRLISRLSKKHGISVLYYSTNQNVQAQLEKGRDLRLQENTAVIKRAITSEPNTYFLDLAASNPPEMFSDANEHLTPDGINKVAGRLMQAALHILELTDEDETVPDLVQGPLR